MDEGVLSVSVSESVSVSVSVPVFVSVWSGRGGRFLMGAEDVSPVAEGKSR